LDVKAIDYAYNWGNPTTRTWTQSAGRTVALYHFDSGEVTTDSSNYSGSYKNTVTTNTSTTNPSAKYAQGLALTTSSNVAVAHTGSQLLLNSRMTVESWFRSTKNLSNNTFIPIISKMGASGSMGWELGLKKLGVNSYIIFRGSNNGTTTQELRSTSLSISSATWYHVAATYNKGAVAFFFNGTPVGSGSISGSVKSDLYETTTNIRIGSTASTTEVFEGTLDEIRLSQVLRYTGTFTPSPTTAHSTD